MIEIREGPIPFDRLLDIAEGRFVKRTSGVVVAMPMAQLDHSVLGADSIS